MFAIHFNNKVFVDLILLIHKTIKQAPQLVAHKPLEV